MNITEWNDAINISWDEISNRYDFYIWLQYANDSEFKEIAKLITFYVGKYGYVPGGNKISDMLIKTNDDDFSIFEIYNNIAMQFMKRFCDRV